MAWFSRIRARLGSLSLDFRLGFRMLVKFPGLTIVGGFAMAFAMAVGAVTFAVVTQFLRPALPLPDGRRIVQLRNWDLTASQVEPRALHDFVVWREALGSVTELGAYRDLPRTLITPDGDARPIEVAELTASAFRIAPSAPILGRVLSPADEAAGAPAVVVLGYNVWRTRFASDARVIGRSVQLGDTYATVVGVMPEGFGFPVAHDAWVPLHSDLLIQPPREGPGITVFGRLAPGKSLDEAQAEFTVLGGRAATQLPATHEHLQAQVVPYAKAYWDPSPQESGMLFSINLFAVMLLVLVCGNVALLLFARAATRENELVVRSALGASRTRIIGQLFIEALVLGAVATAAGLMAADLVLRRWGIPFLEENLGKLPFWYDARLSPGTILYAGALTLLGAAIAGALPAFKVTRGFSAGLRQGSAGGGGLRFGGVWTAVIITQVAFTVAFPALAFVEQRELVRMRSFPAGFAAEDFLSAGLQMDTSGGRFSAALEALRQRIAAEPGVSGVTFVDRLPRTGHIERHVELEGSPALPDEVSTALIDPSYFDVLDTPLLAGRRFNRTDLGPDTHVAIVDQGFVDQVLLGRSAVGRRIRFARQQRSGTQADAPGPWYDIVGVVRELGMGAAWQRGRASGLYLPSAPGSAGPLNILLHAQGDPLALAARLRAIAAAVDPGLRLSDLQRVDHSTSGPLWIIGLWLKITLVLTAIALVLSLAGIYAVLSFTVARRTREIGVRVALGATARSVVTALFRRPLTHVTIGVAAGATLIGVMALVRASSGDGVPDTRTSGFTVAQVALLVGYAGFMLGVCLLACIVPTWRALRVEPTQALKAE